MVWLEVEFRGYQVQLCDPHVRDIVVKVALCAVHVWDGDGLQLLFQKAQAFLLHQIQSRGGDADLAARELGVGTCQER